MFMCRTFQKASRPNVTLLIGLTYNGKMTLNFSFFFFFFLGLKKKIKNKEIIKKKQKKIIGVYL